MLFAPMPKRLPSAISVIKIGSKSVSAATWLGSFVADKIGIGHVVDDQNSIAQYCRQGRLIAALGTGIFSKRYVFILNARLIHSFPLSGLT